MLNGLAQTSLLICFFHRDHENCRITCREFNLQLVVIFHFCINLSDKRRPDELLCFNRKLKRRSDVFSRSHFLSMITNIGIRSLGNIAYCRPECRLKYYLYANNRGGRYSILCAIKSRVSGLADAS
jgi:hypothetical protein